MDLDTWRILLIEDDREDQFLVRELLKSARQNRFQLQWASTFSAGQVALEADHFDVVLVDYDLGGSSGIDLIRSAVARNYQAPIILLTGHGSFELDVEAMECGAAEYLDKKEINPNVLERSIRYAIERKRSQRALAEANCRLAKAIQELEIKNQQLSGLFAHAPAGLVLYDAQEPFRVLMHNEIYQSFFSEPHLSQGMVGLCLPDFLPNAEIDGVMDIFREAINTRAGNTKYDFPISGLPQGKTWWNWHLNPIMSGGKVTGLVNMAVDVTDQHLAQQALQESEAHYRLLFETMLQGVVYQSADGKIISMNTTAEKTLGATLDEIAGKTSQEYESATIREDGSPFPAQEHPAMVALRTGQEVRGVVMGVFNPKEQQYRWLRISAVPLFRPNAEKPYQVYTLFDDITEQRHMEDAVLRSEQRFRTTFENAAVGIAHVAIDGRFIRVNQRLCEITGYTHAELIQKTFQEITAPEDLEYDLVMAERLRRGEIDHYSLEKRYIRKDGSQVWINLTGSVQYDPGGQLECYIAVVEDITRRKQMEMTLRESEQRFHIALSSVPMFVFTMDCDLRYTWAYNPQFGLRPDQILGKREDELLPPNIAASLMELERKVLETGQGTQLEIKEWYREEWVYFFVTFEPITGPGGSIVGLSGAALNITQQRVLEAQQAEYMTQMEVQRRLIEQREMERLDIARDIHDGPLQELMAINMGIANAIGYEQKEKRIAQLNVVQQMLLKQTHELRLFCNELRPPTLAPFGLEKAIRSHIDNFRSRHPHIQVHLNLAPDKQLLPENVRMGLFRIFQESLNNIIKHSQAQDVWVTLEADPGEAYLEIRDNGMGFEVPDNWVLQARSGHLGLVGMRERAQSIGGEIAFISRPGEGTQVLVKVVKLEGN